MNSLKKLSIIICTYNREAILQQCLDCFDQQLERDFELVLVDNASTDRSSEIMRQFADSREWVSYHLCQDVGLSHARNCGAKAAKAEWIGYVDDDALVEQDFVANVLKEIKRGEFSAFGGVYTPWYHSGRPGWYSDTYGGNAHLFDADGRRRLEDHEYFSGGIAFYLRRLITKGSGFSPDFGMQGDKIGYGEENVIQDRIRSSGNHLGIVPSIRMQHLVAEYKLDVNWHLRSQFESGCSHVRQFGRDFLPIAFIRLLVLPFFRLRELPKGGFSGVFNHLRGATVMVLRGFSYYKGRLHFCANLKGKGECEES